MQTKHLLSLLGGLMFCALAWAQDTASDTIYISTGEEFYQKITETPTAGGLPVFILTDDISFKDLDMEFLNFDYVWGYYDDGYEGFNGTIVGNGHSIFYNCNSQDGQDYPFWGGYFGKIGKSGVIRNTSFVFLGRYDATTLAMPWSEDGAQYAGLITGYNYGTIDGCEVILARSGTGLYYAQGVVSDADTYTCYMGGFCGANYGTISNCISNCKVWYSKNKSANSESAPSLNSKLYAAGICGYNEGTVSNCLDANYAGLELYGNGGIRAFYPVVGLNANADGVDIGTITNCLAYVLKYTDDLPCNAIITDTLSGVTVVDRADGGSDLLNAAATFVSGNKDYFAYTSTYNIGLPFLKNINRYNLPTDGNGTFYIKTTDQFNLINSYVSYNHPNYYMAPDGSSSGTYNLLNDIVFGYQNETTVIDSVRQDISYFGGTFNGMGHEIICHTGYENGNIFTEIATVGVIKNLGVNYIDGITFKGDESSSYSNNYAGGIVGYSPGKIINCYSCSSKSFSQIDLESFNSRAIIGGIVGANVDGGLVQSCYSNISVCPYVTSSKSISVYGGGIVGHNTDGSGADPGKIVDCFNTFDSYSSYNWDGYLSGSSCYIGNIVGENAGAITRCYGIGTTVTVEDEDGNTTIEYEEHLCGVRDNTTYDFDLIALASGEKNELTAITTDAELEKYFMVPYAWKPNVTENGSYYPLLRYLVFDLPADDEETLTDVVVHIADTANVTSIAQLYNELPEVMQTATIVLDRNIDYGSSLDDAISDPAATATEHSLIGTSEHPFNGTFEGNGNVISNYNFKADATNGGADFGFFGYVGPDAQIDGVRLDSCTIYLDCETINKLIENLATENTESTEGESEGEGTGEEDEEDPDRVDIGLFVGTNRGTISNCVVIGTVLYDDECVNEENVELLNQLSFGLLAGCNEGTIDHCIIFTPQSTQPDEPEDNKACIAIKSTIGIGRDKKGKTTKTATVTSNKTATADDDENLLFPDAENDIREFTYDQFADGTVAYWLNYKKKGYTGEYGQLWRQGEKLPELCDVDDPKPLYRLAVANTNGDEEHHVSVSRRYANVDDEVGLIYAGGNKPSEIIIDGRSEWASSDFIVPLKSSTNNGIILIEAVFAASTGIDEAASEAATEVRVAGHRNAISISTPAAANVSIHNTSGLLIDRRTVAQGTTELDVPAGGVYVATVDGQAFKVVVR